MKSNKKKFKYDQKKSFPALKTSILIGTMIDKAATNLSPKSQNDHTHHKFNLLIVLRVLPDFLDMVTDSESSKELSECLST